MDYMCQVSSSELGLIDPCLDLCVDFVECALERGVDGAEVWKCGGQARAKETVVEAREEQGCPEAEFGDAIAEAVGQAFDQAVQAQAAQLISDGALRDRVRIAARQSRKMMAQVGCAKAFCELPEQDDGVPQRVDARIGKTQARGALAARRHRAVDGLEGILGQYAVMAQTFDFEQPAIGRKADLAQLRQVV